MSYLVHQTKSYLPRGGGSSILKEEYFISFAIGLENTLQYYEEYDLSLKFTLHEVFIWETVDKKIFTCGDWAWYRI